MKDKFTQLITDHLIALNEEDTGLSGDTDPVAAAGPEPEEPAPETPESELPEMEGENDSSKIKLDYVEMVRKALIMAPKHIDDVDYAKLTKIVDTDNLDEMNELVMRIVRNNYPHPDF